MTAKRFLELCDKWGIKHTPIHETWTTHNRAGHGEFGDMNGVGIHHTGSDGSVSEQSDILWNGYGDLPGPLCHAGIDPTGVLHLAGWGRTNHFGLGSKTTWDHVKNEDYTGILKPGPATIDGNAHFYGFEIMYSGSHPMSDAQRITAVRVSAAICTEHGWKAESVIGHGEWQQGKWDPGISRSQMLPMDRFRDEVRQAIKEGPLPTRPVPSTTLVVVEKGDTFISLAKKYLGDDARWPEIVSANPQLLQPGMQLHIKK